MSGALTYHGGRLGDASNAFGGEPGDWLDLSTGINPNPWPWTGRAVPDWRALPDPRDLARLEQTAAAYFGADPDLCLAVPGSEMGLRVLGRVVALPGVHLPLSYSTHAEAFAPARTLTAEQTTGREPSVLVIANPNNPDGAVMERGALMAALERQEAAGGWLLVDEAFVDCLPGRSIAHEVAENRRLIVTRSFGKFFGLAGVRLGFVLAPSALLAQLRRLQGEWPICAAALSFGAAAYADAEWIATTTATLPNAAARLDAVLLRHGLEARGKCPLFRLVETTLADELFTALARRQILTRPFAAFPDLLRFGLPENDGALARLEAALEAAIACG